MFDDLDRDLRFVRAILMAARKLGATLRRAHEIARRRRDPAAVYLAFQALGAGPPLLAILWAYDGTPASEEVARRLEDWIDGRPAVPSAALPDLSHSRASASSNPAGSRP
jgi:hypothetical protein